MLSKALFLLMIAVASLFFIAHLYEPKNYVAQISTKRQDNPNDNTVEHCILPYFDPWDADIVNIVDPKYDPMVDCVPTITQISRLVKRRLRIIDNDTNLNCRYRCLYPKSDFELRCDAWIRLKKSISPPLDCDFVEVNCSRLNDPTFAYSMLHTQVIVNGAYLSAEAKRLTKVYRPSVLLLIFDAVSSNQAIRSFAKSFQTLLYKYEAVHFRALNKIGLNSRPNAYALLNGIRIDEIPSGIYGENVLKSELPNSCNEYISEENFIIDQFKSNGYASMMAEDWANGAYNWPNCEGFAKPPTTHYMRPFQLRTESDGHNGGDPYLRSSMMESLCREPHHYIMDYGKKFLKAYDSIPKFTLLWMSYLAHDYHSGAYHADDYFNKFFQDYYPQLKNSFVIVMGDHGFRHGAIRKTRAGEFEDNNPFLMIAVPEPLRTNRELMHNLHENSQKLISHYDVYATMLDMAKIAPIRNFTDFQSFNFDALQGNRRGQSLLRPFDNRFRNCKTLEIPYDFCICKQNSSIISNPTTHRQSKAAGRFIVDQLNAMLHRSIDANRCESLTLKTILKSQIIYYEHRQYYKVSIVVSPSDGEFEAIVRLLVSAKPKRKLNFRLASSRIDRLNEYGTQSDCTSVERIRPICLCKDYQEPTTEAPAEDEEVDYVDNELKNDNELRKIF